MKRLLRQWRDMRERRRLLRAVEGLDAHILRDIGLENHALRLRLPIWFPRL